MRRGVLLGAVIALVLGLGVKSAVLSARMAREEREWLAGGQGPHGAADPEVQKGLDAFASGHYPEARRAAEALLVGRNRGSSHAEAVDLLVEAWLAEGNFAEARAVTERYGRQEPRTAEGARARVDQAERTYDRELARLESGLKRAPTSEEAAELQLRRGHLQKQNGRLREAEAAYREVVESHPGTQAAIRARRQLDALHGHFTLPRAAREGAASPG